MAEEEMKMMLDDACPCKDGKLDYAEVHVLTGGGQIGCRNYTGTLMLLIMWL